jgi:hypothetical protein
MKKLLALIVSFVMVLSLMVPVAVSATGNASKYSGTPDTSWYNTTDTTFTLTTADQFMGFAKLLKGDSAADPAVAPVTFEGVTVKLGADMVINEDVTADTAHIWDATGSTFKGTFDGDGKIVTGLKAVSEEGFTNNYGVFPKTAGNVTVKNVTFDQTVITGTIKTTETTNDDGSTSTSYAGSGTTGLIGYAANGVTMENVTVKGDVSGIANVGGLIGAGARDAISFKNCTFEGTVDVLRIKQGNNSQAMAAGLLGATYGNVTAENCTVKADFTGKGGRIAGIVGLANGATTVVTNCHVEGDIFADGIYNGAIGGILGQSVGATTIENCSYKGDINVTGEGVGGIVGWYHNTMTVKNVSVVGDLIKGYRALGGVLGYNNGSDKEIKVENAYVNVAELNARKNTDKPGVGGIIGRATHTNLVITLSDCMAVVENLVGVKEDGGVIGSVQGKTLTLERCAFIGDILEAYDSAAEAATLVGVAKMETVTMTDCYSIAQIYFAAAEEAGTDAAVVHTGELSKLTVTDCYMIEEFTAIFTYADDSNVTGTPNAIEHKNMVGDAAVTNMTGLDFTNEWVKTDYYPIQKDLVAMIPEDLMPEAPEGLADPAPGGNEGGNDDGQQGGNDDGQQGGNDDNTQTQAPETNAPETNATTTTAPVAEESGCASVVLGGVSAIIMVAGAAMLLKKKED